MGLPPSPLERDDPELFLEPVEGWRMWRLARGPSGHIRLCSPVQSLVWPPREAVRAACERRPRSHDVPAEHCGCGIYALSSIERFPVSGVPLGSAGVLGTVSLWGRVVEHAAGYRAELAYPSRLRLVCPRCVARARLRKLEIVARVGDALIPTCRRHSALVGGEPMVVTPAELEAELLSEYAVELLPYEPLRTALARARTPQGVRTFTTQVRSEARAFVRSWTGFVGAVALLAMLFFMGLREQVVTLSTPPIWTTPGISAYEHAVVTPLPGTGDPVRFPLPARALRRPRRSLFPLAFVCGRLEGGIVSLVEGCRGRGDLAGAAIFPPQTRRECGFSGYTRKWAFSVCWISPSTVADPPPHPAVWRMPGVRFDDVFRPSAAEVPA